MKARTTYILNHMYVIMEVEQIVNHVRGSTTPVTGIRLLKIHDSILIHFKNI